MRTVYPIGTTIYKPDKCSNGYTTIFDGLDVKLIDVNGRIVNTWKLDTSVCRHGTDGAHLLKNGNIQPARAKDADNTRYRAFRKKTLT